MFFNNAQWVWNIDIHSMLILIFGIQCNCQQAVSKILNSIQCTLCTLLTMVMLLIKFLYILRIHYEVSKLKALVHFKDIADGHKLDLQSGHQCVLSEHLQLFACSALFT